MDVYENFLRLVDFSEEDIARQLPHWKRACKLLRLSPRDVEYAAEEWIPKYWDMSLHGIRMIIGAYIRELIEITRMSEYKDRGDKIIYCNTPSHPACLYANKLSGGEHIHVASPDFFVSTILNAFFNKSSVLEDGESPCMNPMCNHCGMNRIHADANYKRIVVSPTVMWSWGLLCNESPKTEELINCLGEQDWTYILTSIPHDSCLGISEVNDPGRVAYLACQIRDAQESISRITGFAVDESHVLRSMELHMDYVAKLEKLSDLVSYSDPQPLTSNELTLFTSIIRVCFDTGLEYINAAIDKALQEVQQRVDSGSGVLPANSPKLACYYTPYNVPWVNKAFLDNGVNLTISTFFPPASILIRYFDPADIYASVARQWFCSPGSVNMLDEAELISSMLRQLPLDGVLYGFFEFDRWLGGIQKTLVKIVEEKTGIPHYYLDGNFFTNDKFSLDDRENLIKSIAYKVKMDHMIIGWNNAKN